MAWLEKRGNSYRVVFEIGGHTIKRSLGTTDEREAAGRVAAVERRISMVARGELAIPDNADLIGFLLDNGNSQPMVALQLPLTVQQLVDRFQESLPPSPGRTVHRRRSRPPDRMSPEWNAATIRTTNAIQNTGQVPATAPIRPATSTAPQAWAAFSL